MALVTAVVDRQRWFHDVWILIGAGAGAGVGRCFGSQPRSKVSMTIMRPPQPTILPPVTALTVGLPAQRAIAQRFSGVLGMFSSLEVKVLYPT